jgi:site-specific recombinase XerD
MFSAKDIEMDSTFQKLLRKKKGLSPHTIENYVYAMKSFSDFTGKSPTEIHDLHKNDLKNHVPEFDMWLTDALEDWVADQIESRYTYRGIQHRLVKIKSFLHIFRLKPTPQIDIHKNNVKEDSKYSLTVEDIRKAITYSNPTYKAIFITQSQTGLAISDTLLLDVDDFIKAVSNKNESLTIKEAIYRVKNDDNIIGCFDLRRKKTNNEF